MATVPGGAAAGRGRRNARGMTTLEHEQNIEAATRRSLRQVAALFSPRVPALPVERLDGRPGDVFHRIAAAVSERSHVGVFVYSSE